MKKTVLTAEESSRLIELGVDKKLASRNNHDVDIYGNKIDEYRFCLENLLRILPKKITDRKHIYELRMGVCDCLGGGECWYIKYVNPFLDTDDLESFGSATELIDAIYEMIIWLKQQENVTEL